MDISLTQGKFAIIDGDDFFRVGLFKWHAICDSGCSWRARRRNGNKLVYLSREIMNCSQGDLVVDHINGNTLDNRKINLRVVSPRRNMQNMHIKKTSKYPGVRLHKGRWQAEIYIKPKQYFLGSFGSEDDAYEVYRIACELLV